MGEVTEDGERTGETLAPKEEVPKLFKDVKYYIIGSLEESVRLFHDLVQNSEALSA